ncbi:acyl-CoA dehydrogenase [Streptomyces sp. VB1]|uniref:acyl-CoA dehydrogenase n=1 Tax=Streptomyces sp. VB1 TaxID=2986803 RepID=UPI0022422012|nr:acyl-CoA dehydrogenase [Streptomyces sp. VB1]UZI26836.1 acyl-CoA dehydrogenase [Streptomyces sp. VB1]
MIQDTATTPHAPGRAPRADILERLFGDPRDPANPVGHTPILAADGRAEMFAEGEALLDGFGLNAEFVPTRYGGRLDRLDDLVEVMRAVYRRDPSLGLGYGASSLISSVNVWTSADEEQSRRVADILLGNGKIAAAYHELAHGNDMSGTEMNAASVDGGWCLNGRKEVVTNIRRASALVLFTRTGPGEGSRNHSQLLVDKERVLGGKIRYLPRHGTVGLRGVQLAGAVFEDCRLGPEALIGRQGHGLETAMRSFQVTRATLPAMMTAILDSALRATLLHVGSRSLYGRRVGDLPQVRAQLAGAFADLLACEAFSMVAVRALHLLPEVAGLYAASVKYAVAGALLRAVDRLSGVLGAEFFHRDGEQAIFQKLLRDLKPVGFGHAARAACQTTILPQLGILARRPLNPAAPPEALFRIDADLPEMSFGALRISSGGRDPLAASLEELAEQTAGNGDPRLAADLDGLRSELAAVRTAAAALAPRELTFTATADAYGLVERYVHVLVGTACLRVWWHNRDGSDAFLAEPLWLRAALARVRTAWSGRPAPLPPEEADALYTQLQLRLTEQRSFGLLGRRLSGT